jgi:hypothetical protein
MAAPADEARGDRVQTGSFAPRAFCVRCAPITHIFRNLFFPQPSNFGRLDGLTPDRGPSNFPAESREI